MQHAVNARPAESPNSHCEDNVDRKVVKPALSLRQQREAVLDRSRVYIRVLGQTGHLSTIESSHLSRRFLRRGMDSGVICTGDDDCLTIGHPRTDREPVPEFTVHSHEFATMDELREWIDAQPIHPLWSQKNKKRKRTSSRTKMPRRRPAAAAAATGGAASGAVPEADAPTSERTDTRPAKRQCTRSSSPRLPKPSDGSQKDATVSTTPPNPPTLAPKSEMHNHPMPAAGFGAAAPAGASSAAGAPGAAGASSADSAAGAGALTTSDAESKKYHLSGCVTKVHVDADASVELGKAPGGGFSIRANKPVYAEFVHSSRCVHVRDCVDAGQGGGSSVTVSSGNVHFGGGSGGITIAGNGVFISGMRSSGPIIFNGQRIDTLLQRQAPIADSRMSTCWTVDSKVYKVNSVTTSAGTLSVDADLLDRTCDLKISGVGNICVGPSQLEKVRASVSGSGRVRLNSRVIQEADVRVSGTGKIAFDNSVVGVLDVSVSGIGSVSGFHALSKLNVSISGMGGVSGTYKHGCDFDRSVSGMGSINVVRSA
jgi:hypothetical protein